MGKLLEFKPEPGIDLIDAWLALDETGSLIGFAKKAFPTDSVDYISLERCEMVIDAVMSGIETSCALIESGIEPPDRTYHGDDD